METKNGDCQRKGKLIIGEEAGRLFSKGILTSMREKLRIDLLECFFIDHATGALLCGVESE